MNEAREPEVARLVGEADRLYDEGRLARAAGRIQEVLRLRPGNVQALVTKGRILRRLGRRAAALRCFNQAVARDFKSGVALLERASLLYGRDDRRALRDVRRAISRLGRSRSLKAGALLLEGKILGELNREMEAVGSYRASLRLNPREPEAHWDLGGSLLLLGHVAGAFKHFDAAIRVTARQASQNQTLLWMNIEANAISLNKSGLYQQALELIERGLRRTRRADYKKSLLRLRQATLRLVRERG